MAQPNVQFIFDNRRFDTPEQAMLAADGRVYTGAKDRARHLEKLHRAQPGEGVRLSYGFTIETIEAVGAIPASQPGEQSDLKDSLANTLSLARLNIEAALRLPLGPERRRLAETARRQLREALSALDGVE